MGLPRRAFYTLKEAAARWDCRPADIAGWADVGHFELLTGIGPTETVCGSASGSLSGFVVVSIAEIAALFLRRDANLVSVRLRYLRKPGDDHWHIVTAPSEGIEVTIDDLVMRGEDVFRFEKACELPRRPALRTGGEARYNWEAALSAEIIAVHERGLPATQAEWVGRVQEWFAAHSDDGEVPDERTIRRRLSPIWKSLHEAA